MKMKRLIALLTGLVLLAGAAAGCSRSKPNTGVNSSGTSSGVFSSSGAALNSGAASGKSSAAANSAASASKNGAASNGGTAGSIAAGGNGGSGSVNRGGSGTSARSNSNGGGNVGTITYLWQRDLQRATDLQQSFVNGFYNANAESLLKYGNSTDLATAWEYIGMLTMQNRLSALDSSNFPLLNTMIRGLDYYGSTKNGSFWAYVVNRSGSRNGAQPVDYAFDDNDWITIELMHAYALTGNKDYLTRAKTIVDKLELGEAYGPYGGFRWDYNGRNGTGASSCSTNEMVEIFLMLNKYTGDSKYMDLAKKVYDFMDANLRNPKLNIYYDRAGFSQNAQGAWFRNSYAEEYYSYNTGTAISAAAMLYGATKNQRYLNDAKALAQGAYNYFGNRGVRSGMVDYLTASNGNGNVWFSTLLLSGYTDLYPYDRSNTMKYIQAFQTGIDYAYGKFYKDGFISRDWLHGWNSQDNYWALDHSSNATIYAQLALFYKQYAGSTKF